MRVLVTGANGVIGAAAARAFAARGDAVWGLVRRGEPAAGLPLVLDLNDRPALEAALAAARPDVVVHAAGGRRAPADVLFADNALASVSLAAAVGEAFPGARLILIGSAAQYGASATRRPWRESNSCAPQSPYGLSKHVGEQAALAAARRRGLAATSLRVFNLAATSGGGGGVVSAFLGQLAEAAGRGPPPWRIRLGPLDAVRDFVLLDDVVEAIVRTASRGAWGEIINVCTGHGRAAAELIGDAATAVGASVETEAAADGGPDWSVGDPARCMALLGFRPTADIGPALARAARRALRALDEADARSGA